MQHVARDNGLPRVLKQVMETRLMFDQSLYDRQQVMDIRGPGIRKCLMGFVLYFPVKLLAHGRLAVQARHHGHDHATQYEKTGEQRDDAK
ncbi:hypothetical protein AA16373_2780 [Komagataeibacter swingsii DSM 16373]|nr:hypothetical protein AA16373_2780 [Komagataeibacter swingsii DSM 16373]